MDSHRGIFEAAAAYAFHICNNHPFVDGYKRTALACAPVFLELNAIEIRDSDGALHAAMISVASGRLSKQQLAHVLRRLSLDRRLAR
jgi:death-on-curing protein